MCWICVCLFPVNLVGAWAVEGQMIMDDDEKKLSPWYTPIMERLEADFPQYFMADPVAIVRVDTQRLYVVRDGRIQREFPVSTSRHGIGNQAGSYRTPLGVHRIGQKIGDEAPVGTVFRGRIDTGRIAEIVTEPRRTPEDNITTRILWLEGLEYGINRGEGIDSFSRFIYIHGTDEEGLIGRPASEGCVRMTNLDVIELYDLMPYGSLVVIQ